MSASSKRNWLDPKFRRKMSRLSSEKMKERWNNPEFVERHKRRASRTLKRLWRDSSYAKRQSDRLEKLRADLLLPNPSKLALKLLNLLRSKGVRGFVLEYPLGRYRVDLAHLRRKIAVEMDGVYWHSKPSQKKRDRIKDKSLRSMGWKVIRISERRFRKSPESCYKRIEEEL